MARIGKNQLAKLQGKYKTDEAIGKMYGISRQAVHQLRIKYGIVPVAEKHKNRDEVIVQEYKQGLAGTSLAKKYKVSVSQTYRIIAAAGIDCTENPHIQRRAKT